MDKNLLPMGLLGSDDCCCSSYSYSYPYSYSYFYSYFYVNHLDQITRSLFPGACSFARGKDGDEI